VGYFKKTDYFFDLSLVRSLERCKGLIQFETFLSSPFLFFLSEEESGRKKTREGLLEFRLTSYLLRHGAHEPFSSLFLVHKE
jgi:hypothetical protein